MIIHPAVWSIETLIRMIRECRVFARSDPEISGAVILYPPWVDATLTYRSAHRYMAVARMFPNLTPWQIWPATKGATHDRSATG